MAAKQNFIDYYDVLEVARTCDSKSLESAYRRLLKLYHPDHTQNPDTEKFNKVVEAYKVLRNLDQRLEYDILYAMNSKEEGTRPHSHGEDWMHAGLALDDAEDHAKILMLLYKRRREEPQDAGVVPFYLRETLQCSYEHLEFHKWYLKEKSFIEITEQGTIAITIDGIDHVMSMSRIMKAEKLMIGRPDGAAD